MKISFLSIACVLFGSFLIAQEEPKPKPAKKEAQPETPAKPKQETAAANKKTVKAVEELFESNLELDGVLVSKKNTPIRVKPKSWADLTVKHVVEHGTSVKKGDVILRFETEKLVKAIEDQEVALPLSQLKFAAAKSDLALLEKTGPINLEAKRKSKAQKEDDFAFFEEVRRPMDERNARERLKSYQNYLSYSEEELKQLKKMYENDDMTEETEEIILKRAQDSVDNDRWGVEQVKVSTDRALNTTIPREHETLKRSLKLSQLEWQGAEQKAKRDLDIKRLEVMELERALAKSTEKLAEHKADLGALIIKAPHDGVVYYGATKKGKWTTAAAVEKKLIPGGKAGVGEILLTLVDTNDLKVHVSVAEDKLKDLKKDQNALLTMKWNDELKLDSKVESLSYVPTATSTFDATFSFDKSKANFPAYPGMHTKIKIETYRQTDAIVVPLKAVNKEGDKSYVILKDGTKRWVKTGRKNKQKQEIVEGLKAGEEIEADISAAKPAEKK